MSQLFAWGGQSTGASAPASFLPKKSQGWSPLEWTGWISLQPDSLKSPLQHHSSKASILRHSAFFTVQISHPYMTTWKTIALTRQTFVGKVVSLLLNILSRLVITFLPKSKCLLISWLQKPSAVNLEPPKIKSVTVSTVSASIYHEVMGPGAMILVFWIAACNFSLVRGHCSFQKGSSFFQVILIIDCLLNEQWPLGKMWNVYLSLPLYKSLPIRLTGASIT